MLFNGATFYHPQSGAYGKAEMVSSHPDGSVLIRLNDHWFMKRECVREGLFGKIARFFGLR